MIEIRDIPTEILVSVRKRLGAEEYDDTSFDERIKHMTPADLLSKWSGWKLGDEYWAKYIINQYEFLKTRVISESDAVDRDSARADKNQKETGA